MAWGGERRFLCARALAPRAVQPPGVRGALSLGIGSMNSAAARALGEGLASRNRRQTWDTRRGDRDLGPSPRKPPFPDLE